METKFHRNSYIVWKFCRCNQQQNSYLRQRKSKYHEHFGISQDLLFIISTTDKFDHRRKKIRTKLAMYESAILQFIFSFYFVNSSGYDRVSKVLITLIELLEPQLIRQIGNYVRNTCLICLFGIGNKSFISRFAQFLQSFY